MLHGILDLCDRHIGQVGHGDSTLGCIAVGVQNHGGTTGNRCREGRYLCCDHSAIADGADVEACRLGAGLGLVDGHADGIGNGGIQLLLFLCGIFGLDFQIRKNIFHNTLDNGRDRDTAGDGINGRLIEQDQHGDLGVIRRCISNKGRNAQVISSGLVLLGDLLGGTGLTGNAVAGNVGILTGTFRNDLFQHITHQSGSLFGNDLANDVGFRRPDGIAVLINDGIDQMGGDQMAAVGNCRNGSDQLQRGDFEVLAERCGGQFYGAHVIIGPDVAVGLARQVNTCLFVEAKGLVILIEVCLAQRCTDLDERRVTGVLDGIHQVLRTVAGRLPAADTPVFNLLVAGAIERRTQGCGMFLQRHGRNQDLEGRAGIIGIGDGAVEPFGGQRIAARLFGLLFGQRNGRCRFGGKTFLLGLLGHQLVDLPLQLFIGQRKGIVGVEVGIVGHGQNGARIDIHDDAGNMVGNLVVGISHFQVLFQIVLNDLVDGQNQAVAVLGLVVHFIFKRHLAALGVGRLDDAAVDAAQFLIIIGFQTVKTLVVAADKAEGMGKEVAIGIVTGGIFVQEDNVGQLLLLAEGANLIGGLLLDLALDDGILGLLLYLGQSFVIAQLQNIAQCLCNDRDQIVILDIDGLQRDHFGTCADGQRFHIAVVDGAAVGFDDSVAGLLADGTLLILLILGHLQIEDAGCQNDKAYNAKSNCDKQQLPSHLAVGFSLHGFCEILQ